MDSREELDADNHRNNAPAENSDTMAPNKKRAARRVSFAENTSIRFFDRDDEDFTGTPLMQTAKIGDDYSGESGSGEKLDRNKDFEGEDDEAMEMRRSFLRPIGSPSPGESTFGSASSNDEDNFFGPVSANFIRPGRLSDSAVSDDNHDVTMDSTAFSMHYRSLARSESGIDSKTPTGGHLFFDEKTPTNSNSGSSMVVTVDEKHLNKSSLPVAEASGSHSSNDMSLVGEYPNKYDFDRLSPGLDAILVEGKKLHCVGASDDITPHRPASKADLGEDIDLLGDLVREEESGWINSRSKLNGDGSAAQNEIHEANSPHGMVGSGPSPNRFSTYTLDAATNRNNHESNNSSNQLRKNEYRAQLETSTSSPVKQQHILLLAASPSKAQGLVSTFSEESGSLLKNGRVEQEEAGVSIQKSISKLELLEKSTSTSAFSAKIDKSTIKYLDFSRSPNFVNLFNKTNHISRINFVEDPVSEGMAAIVHRSTEKNSLSFIKDHARSDNHLEPLGHIINGNSPYELSSKNIFADQSESGATAASPPKITWSGNNLIRSLFTSNRNNEGSPSKESESLLAVTASGDVGISISPNFVSSPGGTLVKRLSASPGFQRGEFNDLLLQSQNTQTLRLDKGQDSISKKHLACANFSSATANMSPISKGAKGELKSPFIEDHILNLIELKATDTREIDVHSMEEMNGITGYLSSPAKDNETQVVHSMNLNVEFPAGSPLRKVLDNKMASIMSSPLNIQLSGGLQKLSAKKRNLEFLLSDAHQTTATIVGRSPKLQKGVNYDSEAVTYSIEGRTKSTGHEKKKWTDTYSKFTEEIKNLMSGPTDELNINMIDVLEDILVHQQRSKAYEMLNDGVMPQNIILHQDPQFDKIAQTNSLLHRVVFEKTMLLLKHAKRERLLKRLEMLSSRMQESQKLGENIASLRLWTCTPSVQVEPVGDQSLSVNLKDHEVCPEKLTATKQALEVLDGKILNLTRTFQACCKMKAEQGTDETIALVNEYLRKRASCRLIRVYMQMWAVQSVGIVNSHLNVLISYLDFIMQRTKIIVAPTSSARISFELNETNIRKCFPNMDACIAFTFVFDGETIRKYIGAKTLVQEIQATNSLLGTLLDVLEEVQLAQMEFQNLTKYSFCSPSVEKLELLLCFSNFNSRKKVILTLDMSCLKRGIYPSEVLPLQINSPVDNQSSFSTTVFDEIRHAVKGVRTGCMRILRLCRCVSQVVLASTA